MEALPGGVTVPPSVTPAAWLLRAVDPPMAHFAIPVASHVGGTTFGGIGTAAIAAGSCSRTTVVLALAFTVASLLFPAATFSFIAASNFAVGTAAGPFSAATTATAGKKGMAAMAKIVTLLPASKKLVMRLSYSLDDVIAADIVRDARFLAST